MIVRKAEHKSEYTCISNEILQRKDLSMRAKGLLAYLLSLPENWELHKTEVQKHFTDGRDAVFHAFQELERKGYIQGKKYRDEKGLFRYQYTVYEEPQTIPHNPERINRYGPTVSVNTHIKSTKKQSIYKEEKKDFFKKENQKQEPKESTQKEEENTSISIEEEIKKLEEEIATAPTWLKKHLIELKRKKESQNQH